MVLASDQSSVSSWLVQPIKLSSAAGLCAGRGYALIRQLLANSLHYLCGIMACVLR